MLRVFQLSFRSADRWGLFRGCPTAKKLRLENMRNDQLHLVNYHTCGFFFIFLILDKIFFWKHTHIHTRKYQNIMLRKCATRSYQIAPPPRHSLLSHRAFFRGTAGHLLPLTSRPSEEVLMCDNTVCAWIDAIPLFHVGLQPPNRWQWLLDEAG